MGGRASSEGARCREDAGRPTPLVEYSDESLQELILDAHPQLLTPEVDDRVEESQEVWPEKWGVTLDQFRTLIEVCRQDVRWSEATTMQDLVSNYVVPLTEGKGVGYALLANAHRPLEVNVAVSNCWLESAEGLLHKLEATVCSTDVLYIVGLAMYHCEDSAGPSIQQQLGVRAEQSPFARVLKVLERNGGRSLDLLWRRRDLVFSLPGLIVVAGLAFLALPILAADCIPYNGKCSVGRFRPFTWDWEYVALDPPAAFAASLGHLLFWPAVVLWAALHFWPPYHGRLLVVPNEQCDVFTKQDRLVADLCCCRSATKPELGVCMVKLELFNARHRGVPVQIALPWSSAVKYRRPMARACSTKNDTVRFELADTLADATAAQALTSGTRRTSRRSSLMKGIVAPLHLGGGRGRRASEASSEGKERPGGAGRLACLDADLEALKDPHDDGEDQYEEVNREVALVMEEAWQAAFRGDCLWALAVFLSSSCGMRLVCGPGQFASAVFIEFGLLTGFFVGGCAAAAAARHRGTNTTGELVLPLADCCGLLPVEQGWTWASFALGVGAVIFAIVFCIFGKSTFLGDFCCGCAVSMVVGAAVTATLTSCLRSGLGHARRVLCGFAVTGVLVTWAAASSEVYPALIANGSLAFGIVFGPVFGTWASAVRWGLCMDQASLADNVFAE